MKLLVLGIIILCIVAMQDHYGRSQRVQSACDEWAQHSYDCRILNDIARKHDLRYSDITELKTKFNCN